MQLDDLAIASVVSAPFGENSYIIYRKGRSECLVVDPGFEPQKIAQFIEERGLAPAVFLNTHGHADHIAGNEFLKERWPTCPLVIGAGDAAALSDPRLNLSADYGIDLISPPADREVVEGDALDFAGVTLTVREIPGHSPGHVVFICRDVTPAVVIGGDVLFAGSVGRTDFPGGSMPQLVRGIREKLFTLPDDTVVLPGHGEPTTVGVEKRTNPFVGGRASG